mmetsp:Transcript_76366/g.221745  ORF Transcript_76366/g.221745 Transcript_76366/m.221745 type:complete len:185 (+) Transcript_76366:77-631(+)
MAHETSDECPWCGGFGMDPTNGEVCTACSPGERCFQDCGAAAVDDGAMVSPCLAGPDASAGPGVAARRRRRRSMKDHDDSAEGGGKMSLRGFMAEFAATATRGAHSRLPTTIPLAKVVEGDDEDGEGRLSPKAALRREAVECPTTPSARKTTSNGEDEYDSGDDHSAFEVSGDERSHSRCRAAS